MSNIEMFMDAMHDRRKLLLRYRSKKSGEIESRICAPLDFGPSRKFADGIDRFHFWDYDSPRGPHVVLLEVSRMVSMEPQAESFDPAQIVNWSTGTHPWIVRRDWGRYS